MTRLRVALRVPVGRPLPDIADFVARCEGAGFDGVGIHDHPSSGRDAYLALALAARATADRLFPATSSPVVAIRWFCLARPQPGGNSAGRACLTVAPGSIPRASANRAPGGFHATRSAISVGSACWEEVGLGPDVDPPRTEVQSRRRCTCWPPALRMIELAGEVADGAFLMVCLHPASIRARCATSRKGRSGPAARWPASGDVRGHAGLGR
jgi:5,10-methylenetetrahydromethanopterin reductase